MKFKAPLTIAGVVMFGAFATGCSQQQTADSSQNVGSSQQNVDAAPAEPAKPAAPAPAPSKPAVSGGNCHNHAENASRGTTRHCHPHPNGANHSHLYGNGGSTNAGPNVADMQNRLKAKGYYKGPITGTMDANTKDALSAYQSAN